MRLALGVIGLAVVVWPIRDLWRGSPRSTSQRRCSGSSGLAGLRSDARLLPVPFSDAERCFLFRPREQRFFWKKTC
jgi:hypothetical protein